MNVNVIMMLVAMLVMAASVGKVQGECNVSLQFQPFDRMCFSALLACCRVDTLL